jgi:hypothetical protein
MNYLMEIILPNFRILRLETWNELTIRDLNHLRLPFLGTHRVISFPRGRSVLVMFWLNAVSENMGLRTTLVPSTGHGPKHHLAKTWPKHFK